MFLDSEKNSQSGRDSLHMSNSNASGTESPLQFEESVFLPLSPNESGYGSTASPPSSANQTETNDGDKELRKNYIRHQDSIAIHMQHAQSRKTNDNEDEDEDELYSSNPAEADSSQNEIAQSKLLERRASGGKVVKKLTFQLPDDYREPTNGIKNNRRMSTPTLNSQRVGQHKQKVLNLKLGRQLESLDLKSSVPLSPTRLREGLSKFWLHIYLILLI